jgi:hypothetical protein
MQVTLEIYSAISDELQMRRLSRKLALLCYFLNTRLDNTHRFVHGGVFGRQYTNGYNAGQGMTSFEVVVNQKYVINNASYLDDDKVSDEDFRGFSQHFIQCLSGLNAEFKNFGSYKFINCQPIIVGNYYLRESGIDGRTLGHNSHYPIAGGEGRFQQGTISTVHHQQPITTTYNQTAPVQQTNFNTYQNFNSQPSNLINMNGSQYHQQGQIINNGSQYLQQGQIINNGSQYHQSGNVSVNRGTVQTINAPTNVSINRQLSSTVQAPSNVSINRGVVNNTSVSGSVSGGVVNNNLSGRKTVMNIPSNTSFNNDSTNIKASKRMSSIL